MEIAQQLLEILKYTLPALIVFLTAYFMITRYLQHETAQRALELRFKNQREIFLLRLQAYERLTLFLERIHPASLITRLNNGTMSARELQVTMVLSIREEFEHNLSQQVYVSANAWNIVGGAQEEMIKTITMIGAQLPEEASAATLINALMKGIAGANAPLPSVQALDFIKAECRELF